MKIRTNFVSNSSSSSFVVYGTRNDDLESYFDNIKEYFLNDKNIKEEFRKELEDCEEICDLLEIIYEWTDLSKFETHSDNGYFFYIGKSPLYMKDNQTMREFKNETEKEILTILGLKDKIGDIEFRFIDEVIEDR